MRIDAVDRMVQEWARRDPQLDVSPLEVVGRLLLGANRLEQAIVAALKPLGLSFGDFDVINTGAMAARLDRLERNGLIKRKADPGDGRGVLVQLARKGERLAEQAVGVVLAVDEAFLEPL